MINCALGLLVVLLVVGLLIVLRRLFYSIWCYTVSIGLWVVFCCFVCLFSWFMHLWCFCLALTVGLVWCLDLVAVLLVIGVGFFGFGLDYCVCLDLCYGVSIVHWCVVYC